MPAPPRAAIYFSPKSRASAGGIYAALYCRTATQEQGEPNSLDCQEAACRAYARAHGYLVGPVAREVASRLRSDRTGLAEIQQAIESGCIDMVLVTDYARLFRDSQTLVWTLTAWQASGVRVVETGGIA